MFRESSDATLIVSYVNPCAFVIIGKNKSRYKYHLFILSNFVPQGLIQFSESLLIGYSVGVSAGISCVWKGAIGVTSGAVDGLSGAGC